jgi:hypothetical protein
MDEDFVNPETAVPADVLDDIEETLEENETSIGEEEPVGEPELG